MLYTEKIRERLRVLWHTVLVPFCKQLSTQKAVAFSLAFLLAALLTADLSLSHRMVLFGVLSVGAALVLVSRKRFWYALFLPILVGAMLGNTQALFLWNVYAERILDLTATGATLSTDAEVEDVVYTNAYVGFYVCRIKIDGWTYHVRIESADTSWSIGQVYHGEIQLCAWDDLEDGFDEAQYYRTKNVLSAAVDVSLTDTGKTQFRPSNWMVRWNDTLSARISAHVKNDDLPLAMLLGNRKNLSDAITRDFRRVGILHLLAVSGTHFSVLATMAERLLKTKRMKPWLRNGILAVLAISYMFLTGLSASVRRAGFMFLISLLCRQFQQKIQYFTSLNIATLAIVVMEPTAVLDVGLHLSYLAVCGCILAIHLEINWKAYRQFLITKNGERIRFPKGWRRLFCPRYVAKKAISMLLANLIITCLTLPTSWLYFGELSLASLPVNLLYIPATGVLLFLSVLYLLTYPLGLPLLSPVLSAFSGLLTIPAAAVSQIPHIVVSLRYPFVPFFLVPSVLAVCCLPYVKHKLRGVGRTALLLCLMVGCIWVSDAVHANHSTLVYQNYKLRDGFMLQSDGKTMLIDISDGSKNYTNILLNHAREYYATELDGYLLTHYHNRHLSTLVSLADNWILRKLYLPTPMNETEEGIYAALCQIAKEHHIPVETFDTQTTFGNVTLSVGPRTWLKRSSHPITGLRLTCGDESVVYSSCSYGQTDAAIVDWMEHCTVGIFGAHSPVHKKDFTLHFATAPELLIWNGGAQEYCVGIEPAAKRETTDCSSFTFRFLAKAS